ncbi:hypothetical protein [Nonomuraea africana]|uniref:hypothetical protein n=1 Tax=Nonomuraea africana TaxID=46171 RepID=UPI0033F26F72
MEIAVTVAPAFARSEPRRTVEQFVQSIVMDLPTANCWTLAEALGHPAPSRLQQILARAAPQAFHRKRLSPI